jgi:aspartate/glutamate racemase
VIVPPRIALIHATPVAVDPIRAAFAAGWPEAELAGILDDSLAVDRARDADITPSMFERFRVLARYAADSGAAAILFTCSAFGPAIQRAAQGLAIPVLKPNEAMFEAALARGGHLGMLATFPPSVATMEAEFAEAAALAHPRPRLTTIAVEAAGIALRQGDVETHNRLLAERATALSACDAVMLAHFSTSRAAAAVSRVLRAPVLTAPDAAVAKLKRILGA